MSFFGSLDVSATGLAAQRLRMDVISENIANVNTTRGSDGGPYQKKIILFQEAGSSSFESYLNKEMNRTGLSTGNGVRVSRIVRDESPGNMVYEPSHPDADEDGYVTMPNVNIVEEMVNLISASRSYEANVTAIGVTKAMMAKTLEIGK